MHLGRCVGGGPEHDSRLTVRLRRGVGASLSALSDVTDTISWCDQHQPQAKAWRWTGLPQGSETPDSRMDARMADDWRVWGAVSGSRAGGARRGPRAPRAPTSVASVTVSCELRGRPRTPDRPPTSDGGPLIVSQSLIASPSVLRTILSRNSRRRLGSALRRQAQGVARVYLSVCV